MTREQWLNDVAHGMRPWFADHGHTLPSFRVSIGFTSLGKRSNRIGECWYAPSVSDGMHEIFISPTLAEPERIADVLAHELVHTAVGVDAKHGKAFKRLALAIGLEGKMTATVAGDAFKRAVAPILSGVGQYPGACIVPSGGRSGPPKQSTRLLKVECAACGYTVRVARKWLDVSMLMCPVDGIEMVEPE